MATRSTTVRLDEVEESINSIKASQQSIENSLKELALQMVKISEDVAAKSSGAVSPIGDDASGSGKLRKKR